MSGGNFGKPLPSRIVQAFLPLPNYIRAGVITQLEGYFLIKATLETDVGQLRFEIYDTRDSHGTSAKISGFGPSDINVYGLPILYAEKKILLEIWNDSELNCWCERDLVSGTDVFLRKSGLESYLSRYIKDAAAKDAYLREVHPLHSTGALNYCHYYFESDKIQDRRVLLEACAGIEGLGERWSVVKRIAEGHLIQNDRQSTWRGLCVLWLANDLFFKHSEIEPKLLAEYHLLGSTALNWGGLSQLDWIRKARQHLPFVTRLFEGTSEADRSREVWNVADEVLIGLIFREGARQGSEKLDNLKWLAKMAESVDDADKRVAMLFVDGLPQTGLLTKQEKKALLAKP